VASFADDPNTQGIDAFLDALRHFLCQALLDLQAAREGIYNPRDLAEPDHFGSGQVGHVHFAEKRQHVVLAQAKYPRKNYFTFRGAIV
jgi:hypothetical protein